jgi:hypothetical protein
MKCEVSDSSAGILKILDGRKNIKADYQLLVAKHPDAAKTAV